MNASDTGNALQKALGSAEVSEFWFGMAVFPKSIRCRPRLFGLTAISCPLLCFDSTRKYCKNMGSDYCGSACWFIQVESKEFIPSHSFPFNETDIYLSLH